MGYCSKGWFSLDNQAAVLAPVPAAECHFWRISDRNISPRPQLVFNSLTWQNLMLQDHWAWHEGSGGSTAPQEGPFSTTVTQDKTYHDAPLQLITVLLYYTKWTGGMSLNIFELPSFFSPYFAHQCSACVHIGFNFSNTSRTWEVLKITVSIDFHGQSFLHLSDSHTISWLQPCSPTAFFGIFEESKMEQLKKQWHLTPKNLYFDICGRMHQISGICTCPDGAMRGSSSCSAELHANVC